MRVIPDGSSRMGGRWSGSGVRSWAAGATVSDLSDFKLKLLLLGGKNPDSCDMGLGLTSHQRRYPQWTATASHQPLTLQTQSNLLFSTPKLRIAALVSSLPSQTQPDTTSNRSFAD